MKRIRKETYTLIHTDTNAKKQFPNKEEAMTAAENSVGNRSFAKPFPNDETYLFGPGDGTTSIMVKQDSEFVFDEEAPA